MARSLVCPTCGRPIEWTEAFPFRPFCSERCRLIDLGAWLSGERAIPGESLDDPGTASAAESDLGPWEGQDDGGDSEPGSGKGSSPGRGG